LYVGPDFLETVEHWLAYFDIFGKSTDLQSTKILFTKVHKQISYYGGQILNFSLGFLKTDEFWSTYFGIFGKVLKRPTSPQTFVGQSSKTTKLSKKRKIYHSE